MRHALPLLALLPLVACSGESDTTSTSSSSGNASSSSGAGGSTSTSSGAGGNGSGGGGDTEPMTITFAAKVNGAPFACGTTYEGLGTPAAKAALSDFRLYVHDVHLLSGGTQVILDLEQDGVWQHENVALLDFEDKKGACSNGTIETNVTVKARAPLGVVYEGLTFRVGVPFALNHSDASTAPSPLNLSALFWNWQGGHKFLRVDAVLGGGAGPFNLHLGSTGCMGDPANGGVTSCARPNVPLVELAKFDAKKNTVVVDYGALVAGTNLAGPDQGGASGCMASPMDPECGPVFETLGLDLATGMPSAKGQSVFTVE